MQSSHQQLLTKFPQLEQNRPLAPLVTFGIGGPTDLFYKLTDTAQLPPLLATAQELKIPAFILGGGSNTIFADEGFRGLVIHMAAKKIALEPDPTAGTLVSAESGALLSQVIQFALKNKLSGMGKMMGLPGTIGGAVRGNAGAFGLEIKDIFHKALLYNAQKGLHEASHSQLEFAYRTSAIKRDPQKVVLKTWLKLDLTTPEQARQALAEATDIVKNRISKQPKGKCSGSFFKNPTSAPAGQLLEQIGAKNMRHGGVQVSSQHANWLMNMGGTPGPDGSLTAPATQNDVLQLSKTLQKAVQDRFNVTLEREVQLVAADGQLL